MAVFKRKYTARSGKAMVVQKYSIDFRDHDGVAHRITGFSDKAASLELERHLNRLVALRMTGTGPDVELTKFLESCPIEIRERLGEWGIIEGTRAAAGKKLSVHLDAWVAHLAAIESAPRHCRQSKARMTRIMEECEIRFWTDIQANRIETWLAGQRGGGMSIRTSNSYLATAKAFCAWMVESRMATENPLRYLKKLNEATDKRRRRRAFTDNEIRLLIAAVMIAGAYLGLTGPERALVYALALETGLRYSEIRSLSRSSFNFSVTPATVFLKAGDAKNGCEAMIMLRESLAADLAAHMRLHAPAAPAFRLPDGKGAEMLKADLELAGIPYIDEAGRYGDFHALRHTFITNLARAGVHPKVAQELARHSDVNLTMAHYTHVLVETRLEALSKLPATAPTVPESESVSRTGTDDCVAADEKGVVMKNHDNEDNGGPVIGFDGRIVVMPVDSFGTDSTAKIRTYGDFPRTANSLSIESSKHEKALSHKGKQGVESMAPWKGIEPLSTAPEAVALSIGLPGQCNGKEQW